MPSCVSREDTQTYTQIHGWWMAKKKKMCTICKTYSAIFFFLRKPSAIISVFIDRGVCKLKQEEQDSFDR